MNITDAESKSKEFIATERFKQLCTKCKEKYGEGNFFFLFGPDFLASGLEAEKIQEMPLSRMAAILGIRVQKNN